jgi:hypothetical protein
MSLMVSMPMGHHYGHHGPIVTPLGPRDRAWLEAVAADPRRGLDLFPWPAAGIGAPFYLGRALCHMWRSIRWRTPLTEEEGELMMSTHLNLCRAFGLDPRLPYPWREWRELLDHIAAHFGYLEMQDEDLEPEIRRRAAAADGQPIGYRRAPVRVDLTGGWSIEIPGAMAEAWEEDGRWSAWDGKRTVWFSSLSFTDKDGRKPPAEEILESSSSPEGERLNWRGERVLGYAVLGPHEEEGERMWHFAARGAVAGGLGLCNFFFHDRADSDWAVKTWQTLDHPAEDAEGQTE